LGIWKNGLIGLAPCGMGSSCKACPVPLTAPSCLQRPAPTEEAGVICPGWNLAMRAKRGTKNPCGKSLHSALRIGRPIQNAVCHASPFPHSARHNREIMSPSRKRRAKSLTIRKLFINVVNGGFFDRRRKPMAGFSRQFDHQALEVVLWRSSWISACQPTNEGLKPYRSWPGPCLRLARTGRAKNDVRRA
jgi:hypothetical protein